MATKHALEFRPRGLETRVGHCGITRTLTIPLTLTLTRTLTLTLTLPGHLMATKHALEFRLQPPETLHDDDAVHQVHLRPAIVNADTNRCVFVNADTKRCVFVKTLSTPDGYEARARVPPPAPGDPPRRRRCAPGPPLSLTYEPGLEPLHISVK